MNDKGKGTYISSYALNIKRDEEELWNKFISIMHENNQTKRGALLTGIKLYVKHFEQREEL